jgi:oligoribonuclease NrnB/cAMP/cGMP phosphodiesterase (DHH superfamily)
MNKLPVPIFSEAPNKSYIIGHKDLDGCNGVQVCFRWLKEQFGLEHFVDFKGATYEYVNQLAEELFKESDTYRYIFIVDISISEELLSKLPTNCFIFDHHSTSKYLNGHSQCYWKQGHCGSVIAWMALFPDRTPTPTFGKLMSLCNTYDMWKIDSPRFKEAQDLNVLQMKYGYQEFFEKFYDGFTDFTDNEKKIIKEHWRVQEEAIKNCDILDYSDTITLIIMNDQRLDPNYWMNKYISEGKLASLLYYTTSDRISLRINKALEGKFHAGYFLKNNVKNTNNSKGGHDLAGGCSVSGMSVDEVLELGNILNKELENIKEMKYGQ